MTLKRLILEFGRDGEILLKALYRSQAKAGPGTKGRKREVQALESSADSEVADLGTSGYTVREDVISLPAASASLGAQRRVKEGPS
jgi:hypothetical protein